MAKFTLVAIDETDDWIKEIRETAGRIYTQYVFNADEATHCCEATPSRWLVPIRYQTEIAIGLNAQSEIDDVLANSGGVYIHCHELDRLPDYQKVSKEFDDEDEAIEYWLGNHHEFPFTPRKEV